MAETGGQYTCITCSVVFLDPDIQRDHYKKDWHRYNLKRKVAGLSPYSEESYNVRMEQYQQKEKEGKAKPEAGYCVACGKAFINCKAYANHMNSKKHVEMTAIFAKNEKKLDIENNRKNRKIALDEERRKRSEAVEEVKSDDNLEVEELDSDEWDDDDDGETSEYFDDPIPVTNCLFCLHRSLNMEENVMHMSSHHSCFLPDIEYLSDMEGLLEYLGAKVGQGHLCLWCSEKGRKFRSLDAVQKHMKDMGHCRILHDGDAIVEYADYYDYTSSYPQGEGDENNPDAEVNIDSLDDSGYQLVLPSGVRIGHRSLMRYYRQNLTEKAIVLKRGPGSTGKIQAHYRMSGWVGLTLPEAKKKARDVKYMQQLQKKHWMKLGVKANKLQKHWRDPTMMH